MASVDLSRTAVFLDYDGTISTGDTGVHLLERLGQEGWRAVDAEYIAGEIGSRVCLLDEWDLLPHDEVRLREVAAEVPLDPAVRPLVAALQAAGAEVVIVSDGFGFYIDDQLADLAVPVLTNAVDWDRGALEFPNEDRCCACSSCGTCKQAPIKDAKRRGLTTVLVGDGTSDRKAAALADVVYAKDGLARWCGRFGVAFTPFANLHDIHVSLVGSDPHG
ncbi:MAG: HAD-IB family phosphatase [Acidimicrobiia bacterium]|nr:HAD-IB family phosphatase [Acidimicrobiia bacterium]